MKITRIGSVLLQPIPWVLVKVETDEGLDSSRIAESAGTRPEGTRRLDCMTTRPEGTRRGHNKNYYKSEQL